MPELRSIVFLCINGEKEQVPEGQKEQRFHIGGEDVDLGLERAVHLKKLSASGEEPPYSILILELQLVCSSKSGGALFKWEYGPEAQVPEVWLPSR